MSPAKGHPRFKVLLRLVYYYLATLSMMPIVNGFLKNWFSTYSSSHDQQWRFLSTLLGVYSDSGLPFLWWRLVDSFAKPSSCHSLYPSNSRKDPEIGEQQGCSQGEILNQGPPSCGEKLLQFPVVLSSSFHLFWKAHLICPFLFFLFSLPVSEKRIFLWKCFLRCFSKTN